MGNPVRPLQSNPPPGPGPVPVTTAPEQAPIHAERELPPAPVERGAGPLNEAAERVGILVGVAVERARELPRRLSELKQRFIIIRGRKTEDVSVAAAQYRRDAERKLRQARNRAEFLANEYPVQVIAGIAAAAFVLGFGLRIWRSKHARD